MQAWVGGPCGFRARAWVRSAPWYGGGALVWAPCRAAHACRTAPASTAAKAAAGAPGRALRCPEGGRDAWERDGFEVLAECQFAPGVSAERVWDAVMWDPAFQADVRAAFGDVDVVVAAWNDGAAGGGYGTAEGSEPGPGSRRRTCTFRTPIHEPLCPAYGWVTEAWVASTSDGRGASFVAAAVATTEGVPFGDLFDVETRFAMDEEGSAVRLTILHRSNVHRMTLKFRPFVRRMRASSRREARRAARAYLAVLASRSGLRPVSSLVMNGP